MIRLTLIWCLCIFSIQAFAPISTLKSCPKILPDSNVKLNKVLGTWRLAYVYIDEAIDMEEDNSCGVVEIMQVNKTQMEILLYLDSRKDEATIDRYTKEFDAKVHSPAEWRIYTPLKYLEIIYVTVIGFFDDHLILTLCASSFQPENFASSNNKDLVDHGTFANSMEKENVYEKFQKPSYESFLKNLGLLKMKENSLSNRYGEPFFRRKRYAEDNTDETYKNLLTQQYSHQNQKKHLWTAILSRNNRVSALEYIENASHLMKFGFDINKGQLISFGSCGINK